MKKTFCWTLVALPLSALAQPGIAQVDMQEMIQAAQEMEQCMKSVDDAALDALGKRSEQFEKQVEQLCRAGERDEAQEYALKFGREMAAEPEIQKMRECSKTMLDAVPQLAPQMDLLTVEELQKKHICDEF